MGEKELRDLIPIQAEWSIPQLQENLAVALEGSGPALAVGKVSKKTIDKSIALVVSTSGSTGEAKSVAISSTALIASINASHKFLGATPGDSWSLLLPTTHIAGLNVIFRATALGTKVVDNRNAEKYIDTDFISVVPTQLHKALTNDAKLLEHLTAAEAVLVGGGPISEKMKKDAASKHIKVVTTYGMTETCGGCIYNQKPLDGVGVRISPAGLIQLSGPMMASGYLSAAGEISQFGNSGWFESNDLGEISNGLLKVLGRADDVIISGGEKISLALVEEMIAKIYPTQDLIAFAMPDEVWGEQLCVGSTSQMQLGKLRQTLGAIYTPKKIYLFDQIPKTGIDKPDRVKASELAKKIKVMDE